MPPPNRTLRNADTSAGSFSPHKLAWIRIFPAPIASKWPHTHIVTLYASLQLAQKPPTDHREVLQPCPGGCSHLLTISWVRASPVLGKTGDFHGKVSTLQNGSVPPAAHLPAWKASLQPILRKQGVCSGKPCLGKTAFSFPLYFFFFNTVSS